MGSKLMNSSSRIIIIIVSSSTLSSSNNNNNNGSRHTSRNKSRTNQWQSLWKWTQCRGAHRSVVPCKQVCRLCRCRTSYAGLNPNSSYRRRQVCSHVLAVRTRMTSKITRLCWYLQPKSQQNLNPVQLGKPKLEKVAEHALCSQIFRMQAQHSTSASHS